MTTFRRGDFVVDSDGQHHFIIYVSSKHDLITVAHPSQDQPLPDYPDLIVWEVDRLASDLGGLRTVAAHEPLPSWHPYARGYFGIPQVDELKDGEARVPIGLIKEVVRHWAWLTTSSLSDLERSEQTIRVNDLMSDLGSWTET